MLICKRYLPRPKVGGGSYDHRFTLCDLPRELKDGSSLAACANETSDLKSLAGKS
jgi:hypothetical protein